MGWQEPSDLPGGAPRSPYAHWAWEQAGAGGTAIPGFLSGGATGVAKVEMLLDDAAPPDPNNRVTRIARDTGGVELAIPLLLPQRMINPASPNARLEDWHKDIDSAGLGDPPAPGTVFVAVIDEAIAFAHERFRRRHEQGWRSRLAYLWLQGANFADPRGVLPFGRELHGPDINALLKQHTRHGLVDEDALYRDPALGLADAGGASDPGLLRRVSHGTAVLDLAGGLTDDDPLGDRLRLMAAALPAPVVGDTIGTFAELYIVMAMQRLLAHVEALEQRASALHGQEVRFPIVVNVSLALTNGPKDGGGLLERFMDRAAKERAKEGVALHFVVPTGNHRLARTRAASAGSAPLDLGWQIPPDDRTPNFLEVWGPRLTSQPEALDLRVGLAPPGAGAPAELPPIGWGEFTDLMDGDRLIARAYRHWVPNLPLALAEAEPDAGRERVTLVVPPTVPVGDIAWATPGRWQVSAASGAGRAVDVFVQRDDSLPGYRQSGRQSRLAHAAYRERDAVGRLLAKDDAEADTEAEGGNGPILRSGTISPFATGRAALVVGGRFAGSDQEVPYSGLPVADADDTPRPDVLLPADKSPVTRGVLVATARSGGRIRTAGVSFSAAAATRIIARTLLCDPAASRDDCVAALNGTAELEACR